MGQGLARGMRLAVMIAGAAALVAPASAAALPSSTPEQAAVTNGSVNAIARGGGLTYIGGSFQQVKLNQIGFAQVNGVDGRYSGMPSVAGTGGGNGGPRVDAIIGDGSGGWFISGAFDTVGGVARTNLAHVLADGSVDPAFAPNPNFSVKELARSGSELYAVGGFTMIGGQSRNGVAKLSATSGNAFTGWDPAPMNGAISPTMEAVAVSGGAVYVGGIFTTAGGEARDNVAKLSPTSGNAFSGFDPGDVTGTAGGAVTTIAVEGTNVYVGGLFDHIGGLDRDLLAKLSATTGNAFSGWNPDPSGLVHDLAATSGEVYVGGDFNSIGGSGGANTRKAVAKLSPTSGDAFSTWNPNPAPHPSSSPQVFSLDLSGGALYVVGNFESIGGQDIDSVAKLSTTSGNAFGSFDPSVDDPDSTLGEASAIAVSGTEAAVGGAFDTVNNVTRNNLAAIDANGAPTSFNPSANGIVNALALSGSELYLGGGFSTIGGGPMPAVRNRIAKVSTASGNVFSWNPDCTCPSGIFALALSGSELYVGGGFTNIGGLARSNIAKLSTTSGNAFSGWNPDANNRVFTLTVSGSELYAGGEFAGPSSIGGLERNHIAKLSTSSGNAFSAWNPDAENTVRTITPVGSEVYVGGDFDGDGVGNVSIGGLSRDFLAKLSATSGNAFSLWNPNSNAEVLGIALDGSTVYVGGNFNGALSIGGQDRNRLAALSATSGNAFSTFDPDLNGAATAFAVDAGHLYAGGSFTTVGGEPRPNFAHFAP